MGLVLEDEQAKGECMIAVKSCMIFVMAALCTIAFSSSQVFAGAISMTTTVILGKGTINLSYSSDEDVLRIIYSTEDKEFQLVLASTQRMGFLIQVAGSQVTCSLSFLEEEEAWPAVATLEDQGYTSKTIFATPGWIVLVVQKSEQNKEAE